VHRISQDSSTSLEAVTLDWNLAVAIGSLYLAMGSNKFNSHFEPLLTGIQKICHSETSSTFPEAGHKLRFPISSVILTRGKKSLSQNTSYSRCLARRGVLRQAHASALRAGPLIHHSTLHHKIHFLQYCDVLQRIAGHCHNIRILANFNRPDLILHP